MAIKFSSDNPQNVSNDQLMQHIFLGWGCCIKRPLTREVQHAQKWEDELCDGYIQWMSAGIHAVLLWYSFAVPYLQQLTAAASVTDTCICSHFWLDTVLLLTQSTCIRFTSQVQHREYLEHVQPSAAWFWHRSSSLTEPADAFRNSGKIAFLHNQTEKLAALWLSPYLWHATLYPSEGITDKQEVLAPWWLDCIHNKPKDLYTGIEEFKILIIF